MQLTTKSDYALRTLIYLGSQMDVTAIVTMKEIATTYNLPTSQIKKVARELEVTGYLEIIDRKKGSIKLAIPPEQITLGAVIKSTESLDLIECFNHEQNQCIISPACQLKPILSEALQAFLHVLEKYTLQDLISNKTDLHSLFLIFK
ncbi:Rrf2 family transcriptional regulator [Alkalihalobacillus sp. 1P02AB]|uniref:Rrf2 family transcriptional regulator n=1 Tax=Alkalihalobacillus sp. 1P02AB TaxID=3132260 RepID=UPI0039A62F6B